MSTYAKFEWEGLRIRVFPGAAWRNLPWIGKAPWYTANALRLRVNIKGENETFARRIRLTIDPLHDMDNPPTQAMKGKNDFRFHSFPFSGEYTVTMHLESEEAGFGGEPGKAFLERAATIRVIPDDAPLLLQLRIIETLAVGVLGGAIGAILIGWLTKDIK